MKLGRLAAGAAGLGAAGAALSLQQAVGAGGGGLYAGISRLELLFWFSLFGLFLPGLVLLAWGLEPWWRRLPWPRRPPGRWWLLALALVWAGEARLLHWYWLDDQPASAAAGALLYGGKVWAAGELAGPAFDPLFGFTTAGLERQGNSLVPGESPGALLVAAAAELSGLGHGLFALLAAFGGLALTLACGHLGGRTGQAAAILIWTLSPLIVLPGVSPSGELVGRSFLALAFACWLALVRGAAARPNWLQAGLGLSAALALLTRPLDAGCLLLPLAGHLAWRARGGSLPGRPAIAAGLFALGPLGLWYYAGLTGGAMYGTFGECWQGLAEGSGILALLLVVFFVGPLLLPLLGLALRRGGGVVAVAAGGLVLLLLRPLVVGVPAGYALGPAAGAAATVPLLLLASEGLAELRRLLAAAGLAARPWLAAGVVCLAGLLPLIHFQGRALGERAALLQGLRQATAELPGSVVVVEPVQALWRQWPKLALDRRWQGELPHPDPYLRDRVIFAGEAGARPERIRRAFPRRALYRLRVSAGPELYRLEVLP